MFYIHIRTISYMVLVEKRNAPFSLKTRKSSRNVIFPVSLRLYAFKDQRPEISYKLLSMNPTQQDHTSVVQKHVHSSHLRTITFRSVRHLNTSCRRAYNLCLLNESAHNFTSQRLKTST